MNELQFEENHNLAAIVPRRQALGSRAFENIYCLKESETIEKYFISLLIQNNVGLNEKIDKIIQNLFESGLFVKWIKDNRRGRNYRAVETVPEKLSMHHLHLGFFIILAGLGIATAVFFAELIIFSKINQGNTSHWFWICLQWIVDGQRYFLRHVPEKLQRK